ncbi:GGDEF domain-containing protein [Tissierella sp.]|uniref:GGDEF domain-containing protein n=1 Tax=Tissierella sp. TaxID=41274 RepID=UPI00303F6ACF
MNLNIDIETILIVLILGHLFSGILGIAYMIQRKKDITTYTFLFSRLFETVAWILIGLRNIINNFISISIGNSFLIIGTTLQIIAFLIIKNCYTSIVKKFYGISTIVSICIFNLVALFYNIESARVSAISIIVSILWFFPIYVLLTDKNSSVLQRVIAVIYAVEIVLLIFRAYIGIKLGELMNLMSHNLYNVLFFICLYLIMLMGNVGFILLAKEKSDFDLIKAATYDELTNIFNRGTFLLHAKESISLFSRRKEPVSFLLIDLDNFKRINDVHGHFAGDMVLKDFAAIIEGQLRNYDLFGRFGGEEFTILLPGTNEKEALEAAERLRKSTEDTSVNISVNSIIKYTISIGIVTTIPDENTSIETLYKLSDDALYMAKKNGRNRIEIIKA